MPPKMIANIFFTIIIVVLYSFYKFCLVPNFINTLEWSAIVIAISREISIAQQIVRYYRQKLTWHII